MTKKVLVTIMAIVLLVTFTSCWSFIIERPFDESLYGQVEFFMPVMDNLGEPEYVVYKETQYIIQDNIIIPETAPESDAMLGWGYSHNKYVDKYYSYTASDPVFIYVITDAWEQGAYLSTDYHYLTDTLS